MDDEHAGDAIGIRNAVKLQGGRLASALGLAPFAIFKCCNSSWPFANQSHWHGCTQLVYNDASYYIVIANDLITYLSWSSVMFNYIKRLFGRGKQDVAVLEYREARKLLASSGGQQVLVFLNPIIWHLGAREKQKGAPLTETEVYSIRDQAKCMVMSNDEANFFYSQMDAQSPVPRINPENIWVEWQKIRTKIDRYMPT